MKGIHWLLALVVSAPVQALACGVCIDDKVAATYDHAVVVAAAKKKEVVVFTAIEGRGDAAKLVGVAVQAARRAPGVESGTVRSALQPTPTLSFVVDPKVATPQRAIAAVQERLSDRARIDLLRTIR